MSKLSLWKTSFFLCVLCAVKAIAAPAVTFKTLVKFDGTNGAFPSAGPVQATDGNFYGTTGGGGAGGACPYFGGCGTVFKITAGGKLTTLYSFCSQTNCTDGDEPDARLMQATDGNFYGTTAHGGFNACFGPGTSCGTVFKITPGGKLTILHSFDGTSGAVPLAGLVQVANGNFYGTTYFGGTSRACYGGCGTVFEITPGGKLTTLHSFNYADGADPQATLVQATNGNLYGTTNGGGASSACGSYGCGTVFDITAGGKLTTLHSFCSQINSIGQCTDGVSPNGLVQAANGNFYGTTWMGGASFTCSNCSTVFEITPGGKLTTLYSFCSQTNCTDGAEPDAGLVQATNGNLYGTTYFGGTSSACNGGGCGTVFEITPGGKLTRLHSFDGADGIGPNELAQATHGNFYGTTVYGGASSACPNGPGCGTVYSLSVGLRPFVETLPTSGKVGAAIIILGNNLTGATSVTFNGKPAKFKVVSSTEITTTVPSGATTGLVKVKTPSCTLTSNVNFRVT
jgi:uncharacterized repeat protein (TIGR03803 family)